MATILLNSRQREILITLLKSDDEIRIDALSKLINLSERIIRYNLPKIKLWLQCNDVAVFCQNGSTILVEASKPMRQDLVEILIHSQNNDIILSNDQRQRVLILELLINPETTTLENLANSVCCAKSTLINDLKNVKKWLRQFNIDILGKANKGTTAIYIEKNRRLALVQMILIDLRQNLSNGQWINKEFIEQKKGTPQILQFLKTTQIDFAKKMVYRVEQAISSQLTFESRIEFQLYLAIMICATQHGMFLEEERDLTILKTREYKIAQTILYEIQSHFNISIPITEAFLISIFILGSSRIVSSNDSVENTNQQGLELHESYIIARRITSEASLYLHPWLRFDKQLIKELSDHLKPILYRIKFCLKVQNAWNKEIQHKYSDIYNIINRVINFLAEDIRYGFPDEEIGSITLIFAAALERICKVRHRYRKALIINNDDISINSLIVARLQNEFPNLELIQGTHFFGESNDLDEDLDIVISTKTIQIPKLPCITVSPFINRNDIDAIERTLRQLEECRIEFEFSHEYKPSLIDILEPNNIDIKKKCQSKEEVVNFATSSLVEGGKITPGYVTAISHMVQNFGPYILCAPGVALLHAKPSDGVNQLCIGLLTLSQGVVFGNSDFDPVDIVFVLGAIDSNSHLNALTELIDLIQKTDLSNHLRKAKNSADAYHAIWNYSKKFSVFDEKDMYDKRKTY